MKSKIRGRPPTENPANQRVEVCMRKDQKDRYAIRAGKAGLALTTWMKLMCDNENNDV